MLPQNFDRRDVKTSIIMFHGEFVDERRLLKVYCFTLDVPSFRYSLTQYITVLRGYDALFKSGRLWHETDIFLLSLQEFWAINDGKNKINFNYFFFKKIKEF